MFVLNESLFQPPAGKDSFKKDELNVETKKCKNCLRRAGLDEYKCPYCGSVEFIGY